MVSAVYAMVALRDDAPFAGDCVLLMADNNSVVHWVNQCRWRAKLRSGALLRLLDVLESIGGCFLEEYVPGVVNVEADGISRWAHLFVQPRHCALCPGVSWQTYDVGTRVGVCDPPSWPWPRPRAVLCLNLSELARDTLLRGFSFAIDGVDIFRIRCRRPYRRLCRVHRVYVGSTRLRAQIIEYYLSAISFFYRVYRALG